MGTAVKVVMGGIGLVAVWLVLAVTVFSGTGSVEPRPGPHPGAGNSVATTGGTADPTVGRLP